MRRTACLSLQGCDVHPPPAALLEDAALVQRAPAGCGLVVCDELDLVHVVDPFAARTVTPAFCYFRLHGRKGWRHVYEDEELEELLEMLAGAQWAYVLFNNLRMIEDAARFQELLRRRQDDKAVDGG